MNKYLVLVSILFFLLSFSSMAKADQVTTNMYCVPASIEPGDSVSCTIDFELINPNETVALKLEKVYLNGKEIWPNGPSWEVITPITSLTLSPHNIKRSLFVTLQFGDEMADYYFGKPIIGDYRDKFGGRKYNITVEVSGVPHPISTQVEVKNTNWALISEVFAYLFLLAIFLVIAIDLFPRDAALGSLIIATFSGLAGIYVARIGSGLQWDLKFGHWPPDIPSLIFIIPIAVIHILSYRKNRAMWEPIFTILLWSLIILASKYGANGDVTAVVFSLALWVIVELILIMAKQSQVYEEELLPVTLTPYLLMVSYYLSLYVSELEFWAYSFLIFIMGSLMISLLSFTTKRYFGLVLMYPAILVLFKITNSAYSLAYSVPLLGITLILLKWNDQNSVTQLST